MKKLLAAFGYIPAKPDAPPPRGRISYILDGRTATISVAGSTGEIVHNRVGFGDFSVGWDNPLAHTLQHTYDAPGTYLVSLVLVDKWARVTEVTEVIHITEKTP